ncbi:MAG: hypothetical protein GY822_27790 [Deltaproteobacteria bacterium]|nr:hypothetical protein [Deltaproteobacteria bacterium]
MRRSFAGWMWPLVGTLGTGAAFSALAFIGLATGLATTTALSSNGGGWDAARLGAVATFGVNGLHWQSQVP